MTTQIITPKIETTVKSGFDKLCSTVQAYLLGRDEIVYRVEILNKEHKIEDAVDFEIYKSKSSIYGDQGGYLSSELPAIRNRDSYILFAVYLAINYTNKYVKSYVDKVSSQTDYKYRHIAELITSINEAKGFDAGTYNFFKQAHNLAYDQLRATLIKIESKPDIVSEDVFRRCVITSFYDLINLYSYDKSVSYTFISPAQSFAYASRATEEELLAIVALCKASTPVKKAPAKKGKPAAKKGKTAGSKIEIEASDSDLSDSDLSDNELSIDSSDSDAEFAI
jgi:hypothetical protein